jgi:hypothetical protein
MKSIPQWVTHPPLRVRAESPYKKSPGAQRGPGKPGQNSHETKQRSAARERA